MQGTPHIVATAINLLVVNFLIMVDVCTVCIHTQQGISKTGCESRKLWGAILMSLPLCVCVCVCSWVCGGSVSVYNNTSITHYFPSRCFDYGKRTKWPDNISITPFYVHIYIHASRSLSNIHVFYVAWGHSLPENRRERLYSAAHSWDVTQIRLCVGNQLLEVQKGNRDGRFWTFEGLLILVPCNIIKALCLGAKTEHSVAAAGRMESHSNNKIVLSPPPPISFMLCY